MGTSRAAPTDPASRTDPIGLIAPTGRTSLIVRTSRTDPIGLIVRTSRTDRIDRIDRIDRTSPTDRIAPTATVGRGTATDPITGKGTGTRVRAKTTNPQNRNRIAGRTRAGNLAKNPEKAPVVVRRWAARARPRARGRTIRRPVAAAMTATTGSPTCHAAHSRRCRTSATPVPARKSSAAVSAAWPGRPVHRRWRRSRRR